MSFKYTTVVLVLVVCFLLIQKTCNTPKPCSEKTISVKDTEAEKRIQKLYTDSLHKIHLKEDSLNNVIEDITERWQADRAKLDTANKVATDLLNALDVAVSVKDTASYILGCDSLRRLAHYYKGFIEDYSSSTDDLFKGLNAKVYTLEEELAIWKSRFDETEKRLKDKSAYEDRNVLYAGVGLSGNQTAFGGVEAGLMLKTKKDRIYGLSTRLGFNNQIFYEARYYFPISLRKRVR